MVSGAPGEPPVRLTKKKAITTIELARPPMNPLDTAMRDALIAAIRAVADDPDVSACVIHGGAENFAAGADIKALAEMGYEEIVSWN